MAAVEQETYGNKLAPHVVYYVSMGYVGLSTFRLLGEYSVYSQVGPSLRICARNVVA